MLSVQNAGIHIFFGYLFLLFFILIWLQIVGQLAHRTQPLRYAPHYNPALSEASYLQPSSPAVRRKRFNVPSHLVFLCAF